VGGAGQADVEGRELSDQPWGGRFGEEPDPLVDYFTRSLDFDSRLFREDIAGSRAWAKALVRAGVLTPEEQLRIDLALQEVQPEFSPPPLAGQGGGRPRRHPYGRRKTLA
jgi:argininosuccinate lyase